MRRNTYTPLGKFANGLELAVYIQNSILLAPSIDPLDGARLALTLRTAPGEACLKPDGAEAASADISA
jgi:hypothetical protein